MTYQTPDLQDEFHDLPTQLQVELMGIEDSLMKSGFKIELLQIDEQGSMIWELKRMGS